MSAIVGVRRGGEPDRVGRIVDVNDDGEVVVEIPGRGREPYAWSQGMDIQYVVWAACEDCGKQVDLDPRFDEQGDATNEDDVVPGNDGVWRCLECDRQHLKESPS